MNDSYRPKDEGISDTSPDGKVVRATLNYIAEAKEAKRDRLIQNRENFDIFNLKGDFSHKQQGQSQEFLPKQSMACEQISSFMHQALLDMGDWFRVEAEPGMDEKLLKISPKEMTLLTIRQLEKMGFHSTMEDLIKLGLLGGLMIAKVHGKRVNKPVFYLEEGLSGYGEKTKLKKHLHRLDKTVWQLEISPVRHEDWYPDPTGRKLYNVEELEMDLHEVLALSRGEDAIYDPEVCAKLAFSFDNIEQDHRKSRETGQNQTFSSYRRRVKLREGWGTLIDPETGEVMAKNVVWTVANDSFLIQKPTQNPFWHGEDPYVVTPVIRTPFAVWHRALMDASTKLNKAMNEQFNLMLDTGVMAAYGVRQIRPDWLVDDSQIADGVPPGATLEVNGKCPPGAKVLEPLQTATMSPESMQMYNSINAEHNQAAMTNDLRMGVMPQRQVKATEVVEASQTITSMFTGMAKVIEQSFIAEILKKSWATIAQNADDLDQDEVASIIGKDRVLALSAMTPEERFLATVNGFKYRVFGITLTLNKMKDFRKLTGLLQTIAGSEPMMEEFIKKYDFGKLLDKIMKSLDIDVSEIEQDALSRAAMLGGQPMGPGSVQPGSTPNIQSNIPQASASGGESPFPQPAGGLSNHFPPSRATPKGMHP